MQARTKKSIHRPEYRAVLEVLREAREATGLSQTAFAKKLGRIQTYVSDVEIGERRLDPLQLADWAKACDMTLGTLARRIEKALETFKR